MPFVGVRHVVQPPPLRIEGHAPLLFVDETSRYDLANKMPGQ